MGLVAIKPTGDRMSALGAEIQGAGGPPRPEQAATMERLTERFRALGKVDLVLIPDRRDDDGDPPATW
jgi:hypothetical protein